MNRFGVPLAPGTDVESKSTSKRMQTPHVSESGVPYEPDLLVHISCQKPPQLREVVGVVKDGREGGVQQKSPAVDLHCGPSRVARSRNCGKLHPNPARHGCRPNRRSAR
jgi:hypothetical protein